MSEGAGRRLPGLAPPIPLTSEHDLRGFSCGKPALDEWLRRRALGNEGSAGRTYVVCSGREVVAYYCLATGAVRHAEAPGHVKRNMPDPVPMLTLARLAVDETHQGRGFGSALLRDAMRRAVAAHRLVGFRALVVQAKDDEALRFYAQYGFHEHPVGSRTLFLPVETLIKGL